jgi:hypothetical protein
MTRRHLHLLLFLLVLCISAVFTGLLMAQETTPPLPPERPDSLDLVFEREAFLYPRYERRNPFLPLTAGDEAGPRFEELLLTGIIFSTDSNRSVAMFGHRAAQGAQGEEGAGLASYRVRRGDTLGNVRILEIQQTRVVVRVDEFGLTEQRIMELQRPGQGGL